MDKNKQYLQIAFNHSSRDFLWASHFIPQSENIIIEAGTPLIKKEGIQVVRKFKSRWKGYVLADMKIIDGAVGEIAMAHQMGADLVTASGHASAETLKLFVHHCQQRGITSVIDMLGVQKPLRVLWKANIRPDVVLIHRGRDEENVYGKLIQYKHIAKIKGKYDCLVGAAGGIDEKEMSSALFNGADLVVVNVVHKTDPWTGLQLDQQFGNNVHTFIKGVTGVNISPSNNENRSQLSSHFNKQFLSFVSEVSSVNLDKIKK